MTKQMYSVTVTKLPNPRPIGKLLLILQNPVQGHLFQEGSIFPSRRSSHTVYFRAERGTC